MTLTIEDEATVRDIAREETKLAMKVDETNQLITKLIESSTIAHAKIEGIEADVAELKGTTSTIMETLAPQGQTLASHSQMLESQGQMLEAIMQHLGIKVDR